MEKKLLNNLGIKILSICLAAFFWLVIVNIDDPVKSKTFTNIPVTVINDDALEAKNLAYEVVSGNTVDFTVSGKRTIIEKLKRTDFTVTADLAEMTQPFDTVKINVECSKYPSVSISMGKVSTMTISSEEKITKSFSVKVSTTGAASPGYAPDAPEVSPVILDVTGAATSVKEIEDVKVQVDISGADSDITRTVVPHAYDEKGNEIERSKLKFSYETVTVKIPMLQTKDVPVVLKTTGEPAYGYQYIGANYQPQTIEVKGEADALSKIDSIPISVDVNGLKENKEFTITISDILHDYDVSAVESDISTVVISVTIDKMEEKEITFGFDAISFENVPENYDVQNVGNGNEYMVKLMGRKSELEKITVDSLAPMVDASSLTTEKQTVKFHFTLPEGVKIVSETKAVVRLVHGDNGLNPVVSPTPSADITVSQSPEESAEPSPENSELPQPSEDNNNNEEDDGNHDESSEEDGA